MRRGEKKGCVVRREWESRKIQRIILYWNSSGDRAISSRMAGEGPEGDSG